MELSKNNGDFSDGFKQIKRKKGLIFLMSASIVVGTQWGDEGKGKIIDIIASRAVVKPTSFT